MLEHLHIRDFAIIEEVEVSFTSGLTVFTGETGAGKSIIVDAVGLILGDRADSSAIRANADVTEISAIFSLSRETALHHRLDEQGINAQDGELMLRRVITRDGRSRAWANGSPVPVQLLRELGEQLVDIHGQHAHQSLLKREAQRNLLDGNGQHDTVLEKIRESYARWFSANAGLSQLQGQNQDRDARLTLLKYQVQELADLHPVPAEVAALEEEYKKLANASRLLAGARETCDRLVEDEHALLSLLYQSISELQGLAQLDNSLSSTVALLESAAIQMKEGAGELRRYLESLDLDPERLSVVEARIAALHDIARKHKVKPEVLSELLQTLQQELQTLEHSGERIAALEQERSQALADYRQTADELHECRIKVAKKLARDIETRLKDLGMPAARFAIEVEKIEKESPQQEGMDRIEFLVSVNPGQDLQPLSKVASGGELSRISLAIQVIGSKDKGLPTLIFDEVDAGIGGAVAEIVGKLLHKLAANRQVFCVTHLPQVAALGDHHLQVNKSLGKNETSTAVVPLDREQRVEEISRMLGGLKITGKTREHAREMLSNNR